MKKASIQGADKASISRRTLYNYIDKFDKRELSKRIFDSIASELNFDAAFIEAYHNELEQESLNVTSISTLFSDLNEGAFHSPLFSGKFLTSNENIAYSLFIGLPKCKYIILEVESNLMQPEINSGDKVICEEVQPKFWNRPSNYFVYFIRASDNVYLARVFKQTDDLWFLKMDNHKELIPFDPSEVDRLYLVRRVIHLQDAGPKMFEIPKH